MDDSLFQKGISDCVSITLGGIDCGMMTEESSGGLICGFSRIHEGRYSGNRPDSLCDEADFVVSQNPGLA